MKRIKFYLFVSYILRWLGALVAGIFGIVFAFILVVEMFDVGMFEPIEYGFFLKAITLGGILLFVGFFLNIPEELLSRIESLERSLKNEKKRGKPTKDSTTTP